MSGGNKKGTRKKRSKEIIACIDEVDVMNDLFPSKNDRWRIIVRDIYDWLSHMHDEEMIREEADLPELSEEEEEAEKAKFEAYLDAHPDHPLLRTEPTVIDSEWLIRLLQSGVLGKRQKLPESDRLESMASTLDIIRLSIANARSAKNKININNRARKALSVLDDLVKSMRKDIEESYDKDWSWPSSRTLSIIKDTRTLRSNDVSADLDEVADLISYHWRSLPPLAEYGDEWPSYAPLIAENFNKMMPPTGARTSNRLILSRFLAKLYPHLTGETINENQALRYLDRNLDEYKRQQEVEQARWLAEREEQEKKYGAGVEGMSKRHNEEFRARLQSVYRKDTKG